MIELGFLLIGFLVILASLGVNGNKALLVLLIGLLIALAPIGYDWLVLVPQTIPEASEFCETMGLKYYSHYPWNFQIAGVTCSQVVQDCPAGNCTLIEKKIQFRNYPDRTGEIAYD